MLFSAITATGGLAAPPAEDDETPVDQRSVAGEEVDDRRELLQEEVKSLTVDARIVAGLQVGGGCSDQRRCLQHYFDNIYTNFDISQCNR